MKNLNLKGTFAFRTDIGRIRISNDDNAIALINSSGEVLLAVCDGMGGAKKGDFASKKTMNILVEEFKAKRSMPPFLAKRWLARTFKKANAAVYKQSMSNSAYEGMGTTAVVVLLLGDKMVIGNVGDSRAYSYDGRNLAHLTSDDTVGDYLARVKKISEEEVDASPERHILTNAIGVFATCASSVRVLPYFKETILLCSDGLYNNISEASIRACLGTDERVDEKVNNLIAEANGNGGSDNIGISLWECGND